MQERTRRQLHEHSRPQSLSGESSKLVSSDSEDLESLVVWADNLMKKVLQELTSLKRKVEAISNTPVEVSGNVEQLTELHNELMWERQAKKIYPDRDFEKEHDQNDYNALCKKFVGEFEQRVE